MTETPPVGPRSSAPRALPPASLAPPPLDAGSPADATDSRLLAPGAGAELPRIPSACAGASLKWSRVEVLCRCTEMFPVGRRKDALDALSDLAIRSRCLDPQRAMEDAHVVKVDLVTPSAAHPGATVELTLRITNTAPRPVLLLLEPSPRIEVRTASGAPALSAPPLPYGCGGVVGLLSQPVDVEWIQVALPAGASIARPLPWRARYPESSGTRSLDGPCVKVGGTPLAVGAYRLDLDGGSIIGTGAGVASATIDVK